VDGNQQEQIKHRKHHTSKSNFSFTQSSKKKNTIPCGLELARNPVRKEGEEQKQMGT
jgi:hypothetical protein